MAKDEGKSRFDRLVDEIQSHIREEEMSIFSETVLHEFDNPSNVGRLEDADGEGELKGPCGDTMWMFVRINEGKVAGVSFITDGCGATIACGSMLTKIADGKKIAEVLDLSSLELIEALDGLPNENLHCARLAVATLHRAIKDTEAYRSTHGS